MRYAEKRIPVMPDACDHIINAACVLRQASGGLRFYKCCGAEYGRSKGCRCYVFPHSAKADASRDAIVEAGMDPDPEPEPAPLPDTGRCVHCDILFDKVQRRPGGVDLLSRSGGVFQIKDTKKYCDFTSSHPGELSKRKLNSDRRIYSCCGSEEGSSSGCRFVVFPHEHIDREVEIPKVILSAAAAAYAAVAASTRDAAATAAESVAAVKNVANISTAAAVAVMDHQALYAFAVAAAENVAALADASASAAAKSVAAVAAGSLESVQQSLVSAQAALSAAREAVNAMNRRIVHRARVFTQPITRAMIAVRTAFDDDVITVAYRNADINPAVIIMKPIAEFNDNVRKAVVEAKAERKRLIYGT